MSTTQRRIAAGYRSVITTPLYLRILELNPYADLRFVFGMIVDLETSVLGKDVTVYSPVNLFSPRTG